MRRVGSSKIAFQMRQISRDAVGAGVMGKVPASLSNFRTCCCTLGVSIEVEVATGSSICAVLWLQQSMIT